MTTSVAQSDFKVNEFEIMALFVSKFPNYIQFGDQAAEQTKVHILGSSHLAEPLEKISEKGGNIIISTSDHLESVKETDILIVGDDYAEKMYDVLQFIKDQNVLIIGHHKGLEEKGAGINFFVKDEKVKFKISKKAIKANQLKVSSQLMRLAIIVD